MLTTERCPVLVDLPRRFPMTGARETAPVEILLVEDSPDDADLMLEALNAGTLNFRVTLVDDGEEAIAYLRGDGARTASAIPDLILLDLHLPKMNGHEVLAEIKQDMMLRRI